MEETGEIAHHSCFVRQQWLTSPATVRRWRLFAGDAARALIGCKRVLPHHWQRRRYQCGVRKPRSRRPTQWCPHRGNGGIGFFTQGTDAFNDPNNQVSVAGDLAGC